MNLSTFDNVKFDRCTEQDLIELASILNSFKVNNPDVDLSCVVDKVSQLLKIMGTLNERNVSIVLKNDALYCKNLELESHLESLKKEKILS